MIAGGWVVGWFIEPVLYTALIGPTTAAIKRHLPPGTDYKVVFSTFTEPFMLQLRLSFMIGLVLALPFIVLQLWGFVEPGLKTNEKKPLKTAAPVSVALFALGATFCWFVLPSAYGWFTDYLYNYQGASIYQDPNTLILFSVKLMGAFGLGFQLPLIVFVLGRIGIITPGTMMRYWRQGTVFVFFASMVLTPSNDPLTMLMMAIPLCILMVISVYAVHLTTRHRKSGPDELNDLD